MQKLEEQEPEELKSEHSQQRSVGESKKHSVFIKGVPLEMSEAELREIID